jgi:dCMP deaminase
MLQQVNLEQILKTQVERQEKWDFRFLSLAKEVASWSKDPSTKVGSVIVRADRTVASVGYNGFPRGTDDSEELYNDRAVKYERVVHAECNAILNAKEPLNGYTCYIWPLPSCANCAATIIQSGITSVVYTTGHPTAERFKDSIAIGGDMFDEAGIERIAYPYEPE